jgi:hypothetical protein
MTQFALTPRPGFLTFASPEQSASRESWTFLDPWINSLRLKLEAASSNRLISSAAHPLTSAAYAETARLPHSMSAETKLILERLANAVPFDSRAVERPIHLAFLEDDSVVLEWIRRDRRLGFSLENDKSESGWFYVYSVGSSMRSEAGSMDQLEMDRLVTMMTRP